MFRRRLFGYHLSEVDNCISKMESQISEKNRRIDELEMQIRRLEYDQEVLKDQIAILRKINQSRIKKQHQWIVCCKEELSL